MTDGIASANQQGIISTQIEQVQNDRLVVKAPQTQQETAAPVPPPPESGRGASVDTSA